MRTKNDKMYHVDSSRNILVYTIESVDDETEEVILSLDNDLTKSIVLSITDLEEGNGVKMFATRELAYEYKLELDRKYEKAIHKYYEKILKDAITGIQPNEVEIKGKLLKSLKTTVVPIASGGKKWKEAALYEYNKKRYAIAYEIIDASPISKRDCICFKEVGE